MLELLIIRDYLFAVLKKRKVEAHGDFILGPVSPKEYKDTVAELNGSQTNRVFEFFKINPPERVGFAKHCEAAEKKVAALAAAEADAEETSTSPRAAPKKIGRRGTPAAATATAEGKARKKRGGQPADSPPSPKRTRVVDVETGLVEDVIAAVPLRSAAPSVGAGRETTGPLLVPLSPKEKDSDDDSDVRIVSSVGDAPRKPSPVAFGAEAPCDKEDSSSTSTSSSGSSSDGTEQSASPSAPATEKDDIVAEAGEDEEEEPESSSYRVTPEEPRAAAVRLQVPAEAKLIGGKTIRFLGLTSGGHERQFLEEAGESLAIPHEEEFFGKLSAAELTTACGDLSLKAFIASRCLARRLDQESREAKEESIAVNTSLQNRVAELEGRLAAEQERTRRLQREKEEAAKSSEAALKMLRQEVEVLGIAKGDMHAQLVDREAKLAEAQKEASELSGTLERYEQTIYEAGFTFGLVRVCTTPQACIYPGQIGASCRVKRTSCSVKSGPTQRSRRALAQAKSGPRTASSGLHLQSNQDRCHVQACAYSGQIGASYRVERTSSSVKSGPMQRSRRALTQVKSGPRTASSGLHLRSRR
jgi:hypothetical protein